MTTQTHFDSIKLPSGRYVNMGHTVRYFGQDCVVTGWYPEIGCLQLRRVGNDGITLERGSWPGNPERCE